MCAQGSPLPRSPPGPQLTLSQHALPHHPPWVLAEGWTLGPWGAGASWLGTSSAYGEKLISHQALQAHSIPTMVPQDGSEFTNKKEDSKNPDNTRLIKPEMLSPELVCIGASFPGGYRNVPVNQNKVRLE